MKIFWTILIIVILLVVIYVGYKMIIGNKKQITTQPFHTKATDTFNATLGNTINPYFTNNGEVLEYM